MHQGKQHIDDCISLCNDYNRKSFILKTYPGSNIRYSLKGLDYIELQKISENLNKEYHPTISEYVNKIYEDDEDDIKTFGYYSTKTTSIDLIISKLKSTNKVEISKALKSLHSWLKNQKD